MEKVQNDTHVRSSVKSIIWRIWGVLFLAAVTFYFTGDLVTTSLVTIFHHGIFLVVYYLHERFWLWLRELSAWADKWKGKLRPLTYEIILGNLILGIITFYFTGSWKEMTAITLTYILNKLWMYVIYDKIWDRITWGRT